MSGKLSIVATPIGNLEDITLRALRVLKEADIILCEDTRVSRKLLLRHDIATPTRSFHAHSGKAKYDAIAGLLAEGRHLALVTDAGTPGISDPGSDLVTFVRESLPETVIEAIPGPSALSAALSIAGIRASRFAFFGFLPHKKGRETMLREICASDTASVFYESTHRTERTLESLTSLCPQRRIALCKELTKTFEEVIVGNPEEVLLRLKAEPGKTKGEFVVIVEER